MYAFAPSAPLAAAKPALASTSFAAPLAPRRAARAPNAPTMVLSTTIRTPYKGTKPKSYSGINVLLAKADEYMANSVRRQYLALSNPYGVYNLQCTEGSVKFAAEAARVRALNAQFRALQAGPAKRSFALFENRRAAIVASHGCHHEETQFADYSRVAATYNVARSEALGQCFRYAAPETVEEAAMVRYIDIQQNNAANPSGVYSTACNEGAARGQAEDVRIAALNVAYRQGQKSVVKLLNEKYEQKRAGYAATHGCEYEEGLVNKYPALGAAFRPKTYGY